METPYYTDQTVKIRIDEILQKCATLFSNLGTSTNFDVQSPQRAKETESQWLKEIQQLDPILYERLVPSPED
jgi:hypothetical protein